MPKDSILSRFKASLAGQAISGITGGLLTVGLARLLTNDEYGTLFLALAAISIFKIVSRMGFAKSAARYISDYRETHPDRIRTIVRTSITYNAVSLLLSVVLLVVSAPLVATALDQPELTTLFLLGGLYLIASTATFYVRFVLQGLEHIAASSYIHGATNLIKLVAAIGLVAFGFGAAGAFSGYILGYAIAGAVGGLYLLAVVSNYDKSESSESDSELRTQLFRYSFPLTLTDAADTLDKQIDTVLIGFFLSPVAVSFYVIAKQVERFLEIPVTALGFTVAPSYSSSVAAGEAEVAARLYRTSLERIFVLYFPIAVGVWLVADPLLPLVFGESYAPAVPVLQLFSVYLLLRAFVSVTDNGLDYLGRAKARSITISVSTVLNIGLNVVLIPIYGIIGAVIATTAAQFLYASVNAYLIVDELPVDLSVIGTELIKYGLLALLMLPPVILTGSMIDGWAGLVSMIVVGASTWVVAGYYVGLITELRTAAFE